MADGWSGELSERDDLKRVFRRRTEICHCMIFSGFSAVVRSTPVKLPES